MDFLILAGVAVLCFIWGWNARERMASKKLDSMLSGVEAQIRHRIEEEKENTMYIKIEKHDNVFFVYGLEDNQFLAQGSSIQDLEKMLATRFPGKRFAAKEENLNAMGIEPK